MGDLGFGHFDSINQMITVSVGFPLIVTSNTSGGGGGA